MNGEIVDRTKNAVIDLDEYAVEIARQALLNDELAVGIAWEALNLIQTELYITLRTVGHILLSIGINPGTLIEHGFVKSLEELNGLFEEGESQLWQLFNMYYIIEAGINVLRPLEMDSKKEWLYENFIMEPGHTPAHPLVAHETEAFTTSYCC